MSLNDSDPTDFEGILPVLPPTRKAPRDNATTAASAAGVRAFTAQAVAFYFRAPVKAFFRTRVDYLAYARSISPDARAGKVSWQTTTPGLLANAVHTYGWRFIPEQVLPPLCANVIVGAALYAAYLHLLGNIYEPSSHAAKVVYPPPPPSATFAAGFAAGGIQSFIAAPLDALQTRFDKRGTLYADKTMWQYGKGKLYEIGVRGIFAGWGLSFLKDSFGSAMFFSTFEYVKAQGYYSFVRWYYGSLGEVAVDRIAQNRGSKASRHQAKTIIRPHYALEPMFLMLAGVTASVAQQGVLYPLVLIQTRHFERLEELDKEAVRLSKSTSGPRGRMLKAYYNAYQETWKNCKAEAAEFGGLTRWLYRHFWWNTIKNVPSTSAGLIIFELVRRKYGFNTGEVKINQDGYDILLN